MSLDDITLTISIQFPYLDGGQDHPLGSVGISTAIQCTWPKLNNDS